MAHRSHIQQANRPVVVAVHGSASTATQWKKLANRLAGDFDVFAPNLPGYGGLQDVAAFGNPTLYADADPIARIVRQASRPVHLVAHSYGAAVAFRFALQHPNDILSLTLIEPALFHLLRNGSAEDMKHYTEISAIANAVRISCHTGTPSLGMARFVDYWNGAGTWSSLRPDLQSVLAALAPQVGRNFEAIISETWPVEACQHIRCPTVVMAGGNSHGPAKKVSEIMARAIPHARLEIVPGAAHMMPVTHPELVNPLIVRALGDSWADHRETLSRQAA